MAYTIVWPGTLPQQANEDFSESGGVRLLSTPVDSGPAKVRRRGAASSFLGVTLGMTTAQVGLFETFVKTTLSGVKRFGFPHPRTGILTEARITPSDSGKHYAIQYVAYDQYDVSFEVEILP